MLLPELMIRAVRVLVMLLATALLMIRAVQVLT